MLEVFFVMYRVGQKWYWKGPLKSFASAVQLVTASRNNKTVDDAFWSTYQIASWDQNGLLSFFESHQDLRPAQWFQSPQDPPHSLMGDYITSSQLMDVSK